MMSLCLAMVVYGRIGTVSDHECGAVYGESGFGTMGLTAF
jgi:hypothetical protein